MLPIALRAPENKGNEKLVKEEIDVKKKFIQKKFAIYSCA